MKRLCLFVLTLIASATYSQHDDASAVLARGSVFRGGLHVSGSQTLHGAEQQFGMHMEEDFRFRLETVGDLPECDGFDGTNSWHLNGSGVPHVSNYSDRDFARMLAYVQAGVWACKNSPIEVVSEQGDRLVIKCRDGSTTANLELNPKSHTAMVLSCWGSSGAETWTFSEYRLTNGQLIPSKILHESGETKDKTVIEKFNMDIGGLITYRMPLPSPVGFTFDVNENENIEVKRMFGYLFVKPKLDGKDEGWWFLDTGAEIMVIDPVVARSHKMKIVGKDSVSGVVANITTNFSKGIKFNLGPVTIQNSSYMEFDMKPFSDALGIKLAGICGYDFISRAVLDIDPKKSTIGVLQPRLNILPEGSSWTSFLFHGNMPSLLCNFEGNKSGLFTLDTGSGSTVDFFSPCVKKFELLKDRKVENVMTGGAGGSSESKTGVLDWFQFGPKKFEKPKAGFQITTKGGFASPYVDGNIGMGFMGKFRMILDYNSSKLALVESK